MTGDPFYRLAELLRPQEDGWRLVTAELTDPETGAVAARGQGCSLQGRAAELSLRALPVGALLLCLDGPEGMYALCRLTQLEGA